MTDRKKIRLCPCRAKTHTFSVQQLDFVTRGAVRVARNGHTETRFATQFIDSFWPFDRLPQLVRTFANATTL